MADIPTRIIEIATALLAQNPSVITRSDDECRVFMKRVAEQVVFELGNQFGLKSAGVGRPQGPSQIAWTGEPTLSGWRILELGGTPAASILAKPPHQRFDGQVFIPVAPVDHLHTAPPMPAPVPWPSSPSEPDIAHVLDRLAALERAVDRLTDQLPSMKEDIIALETRRYVSKNWFGTIVSVPE